MCPFATTCTQPQKEYPQTTTQHLCGCSVLLSDQGHTLFQQVLQKGLSAFMIGVFAFWLVRSQRGWSGPSLRYLKKTFVENNKLGFVLGQFGDFWGSEFWLLFFVVRVGAGRVPNLLFCSKLRSPKIPTERAQHQLKSPRGLSNWGTPQICVSK